MNLNTLAFRVIQMTNPSDPRSNLRPGLTCLNALICGHVRGWRVAMRHTFLAGLIGTHRAIAVNLSGIASGEGRGAMHPIFSAFTTIIKFKYQWYLG